MLGLASLKRLHISRNEKEVRVWSTRRLWSGGTFFQATEIVKAKSLRWEFVWCVQGQYCCNEVSTGEINKRWSKIGEATLGRIL